MTSITSTLPSIERGFDDVESVRRSCEAFRTTYSALASEIGKVLVGQTEIVDLMLTALFANGHVLLEGVPGLGKTLLVRTLGQVLTLPFSRIQFTPDLMPADITGTSVFLENPVTGVREFQFHKGPIFAQLVLADEINRATPKSQAALLEAMQEKSVTIGGRTHQLDQPFYVMATQNPIEQEGTYCLPEAQLDRFLLKVVVPYATQAELNEILKRTTATATAQPQPVLDAARIISAQRLAREVIVAPHVRDYAIRLVLATHPGSEYGHRDVDRYIHVGVSPRGAQALISAGKVRAIVDGRVALAFRDIQSVARPALRHRIMRSFEAEADGVTTDDIVDRLIDITPYDPDEET
ncbi:MAG: AAA family ATPase [Phycisphaerales bacterium]